MARTARRRRQRIHRQLARAHRRPVVIVATGPVVVGTGTLSARAHPVVVRLRLTAAERIARYEHLLALRDEGLTQVQIAAQVGLSRPRVGHILAKAPPKPNTLDDEIIELHTLRWKQREIALHLGIHQSLVHRRLERVAKAGLIPPLDAPAPAPPLSRPFALVTWFPGGDLTMAPPRYFATEDEADAAKAAVEALGEPATVVNIANPPSRRRTSIKELLTDKRPMMETPYSTYRTRNTL
jgi:predicted XRE-type DNA-binding protein